MHRLQADGPRAAPPAPPWGLSTHGSSPCVRIRHYPVFLQAIPVRRARRPRVTRQSAALIICKHMNPARLACLRRAASVRSEPGSNSPCLFPQPRGAGDLLKHREPSSGPLISLTNLTAYNYRRQNRLSLCTLFLSFLLSFP